MPELLSDAQIDEAMADLKDWRREGNTLRRTVEAYDFPTAIRILDAVAVETEKLGHHPDVDLRYKTLHFSLTTHSVGGLTVLDTELAHRIETAAGSYVRAHE
ncbi:MULTISPECIES: 4a-hydroxytetrahydrobiopterin dehydratase [Streptomycetaceae]|uniref:Putative pterin-4-alpha-carbinolamine dehydratase n=1 Tax=Streptantibioticus cattleyicolor (strain ATCC 35852 / DSM 46488 / JCM 4925 / NBRC 14057 / NRRL 8057) TaxID=1003195 RepID=F8JQJ0_STREN|nr:MULTISPECIES: 4a-hydroxytetrahydrobiopterin dehydratase [Streptomycetaceae]AEW97835.1 putative pterin-4-alpha-carbinolamine dehydratase [Streptantibioticus cattleyicolor NRRL 8057 = DSM 46488]MYS62250.1 4a-hydroxytetrahydrobiopterin dehydratase [Streptomyces sp. SID5468]CCB78153.1 putative pterin-4-alpha-carbinolamine dehydratase [Streptantibioticus cattleyicolor NRRL 8057 = DSM 46488]